MKRLPIDLSLKTVSTKVSTSAWDRVSELKDKHGCRVSDIVSVCLLYMPESEIERILAEQEAAVGKLPKAVQGLLRSMDKLTDEQRQIVRDALS